MAQHRSKRRTHIYRKRELMRDAACAARRMGLSFRDIARLLGCSKSFAHDAATGISFAPLADVYAMGAVRGVWPWDEIERDRENPPNPHATTPKRPAARTPQTLEFKEVQRQFREIGNKGN